jgi:hypothetical protein
MKPIISKNLTPLPPFTRREGGFKASPRFGERFGEGLIYTLKTFKTPSKKRLISGMVHLTTLFKYYLFGNCGYFVK